MFIYIDKPYILLDGYEVQPGNTLMLIFMSLVRKYVSSRKWSLFCGVIWHKDTY